MIRIRDIIDLEGFVGFDMVVTKAYIYIYHSIGNYNKNQGSH